MLFFKTQGDALTRGRQQGEACYGLASPWIERVWAEAVKRHGAADEGALHAGIADDMARWYAGFAVTPGGQGVLEQMHGIAEGLGMTRERYLAMCYLHMKAWAFQCTTCSAHAGEGGAAIFKTDDIHTHERGLNVCEVSRPAAGYASVQPWPAP